MADAAPSAAAAPGPRRAVAAKRRTGVEPAGRRRPGRMARPGPTAAFRWARVLLLVVAVVVGLPLAHAMFGEAVALLGGAVAFGFLLGRWTGPGR